MLTVLVENGLSRRSGSFASRTRDQQSLKTSMFEELQTALFDIDSWTTNLTQTLSLQPTTGKGERTLSQLSFDIIAKLRR